MCWKDVSDVNNYLDIQLYVALHMDLFTNPLGLN